LQSEISNTERKMKNVRFGLFILASACLICLLAPCGALAQAGSVIHCCYNAPSSITPVNGSAVQLLSSAQTGLAMSAALPGNSSEMPAPVQLSSDLASIIPGKATEPPAIAESRELSYMRQS
jgi:hypothetical protein